MGHIEDFAYKCVTDNDDNRLLQCFLKNNKAKTYHTQKPVITYFPIFEFLHAKNKTAIKQMV